MRVIYSKLRLGGRFTFPCRHIRHELRERGRAGRTARTAVPASIW
jgi:hypothetical protein